MVFDPKKAVAAAMAAQEYFGVSKPLRGIGWGISGYVYLSPDHRTAVKIHHHESGFKRELEVYRKLWKLGITQLQGLTVPKLRGVSEKLNLIQMDFVSAPYLLDFAGVLYTPPEREWDEERIATWHKSTQRMFGNNVQIAYSIYHALTRFGLYYVDMRQSNINLTGLPDLEPDTTDDSDDF